MNCNICLRWLHGYLDNELDTATAMLVADHLDSCSKCKRQYEEMKVLKAAIKEKTHHYEMPEALTKSIFADIEAQTTSSIWEVLQNITKNWGVQIFSAAAVAAVLLLYVVVPSGQDIWVDEAVSEHVRSLMAEHLNDVASSDKHTVKPWFTGKIDFSPPVYDFTTQGYPLLGGRLEYLQHQNAAALTYRHNKHIINAFILPVTEADESPQKLSNRGYNIIYWQQNHMRFILVSDLNTGELMTLCQLMQKGI